MSSSKPDILDEQAPLELQAEKTPMWIVFIACIVVRADFNNSFD